MPGGTGLWLAGHHPNCHVEHLSLSVSCVMQNKVILALAPLIELPSSPVDQTLIGETPGSQASLSVWVFKAKYCQQEHSVNLRLGHSCGK